MVCDGPDPPEHDPHELSPPPVHNLALNGNLNDDSDEETADYNGYEPLPQEPDGFPADFGHSDSDNELTEAEQSVPDSVPPIEPVDTVIVREVWSAPRPVDPIQMDSERAQQVMSAMANFALPQSSIPAWAQSVTEDQWRQTLHDRIQKLNTN